MKRVRAEVLNAKRVGAYHSITIVAPQIAERVRPGQFVSVEMPQERTFLLRRHFSIHQASRRGGWAGTLEFVFDVVGPGTRWLSEVKTHQFLDVIGPLGKGFAYPTKLSSCLLISEGHGSASMYFLGQELRARGKRVDMLVGGESQDQVFKPIEAKRLAQTIVIKTEDGTLGETGDVVQSLAEVVASTGAQVVYAAARRATLRRIAEFCAERAIPSQFAVEEYMACGIGLCFSCVVPVIRKDGSGYDNLRACTDGPVFNPARILWDRWMGDEPTMTPTPPEGFPAVRSWPG